MRSALRVQVALCCAALSWSGCARCSREAPPGRPQASSAVADRPAVLAEVADDRVPEFIFAERGGGVAWVAEEGGTFRVVQDGRAGKPYAAVGAVVLSPDGRRCAYAAAVDGRWRVVVDGEEGASFADVSTLVFSADGAHLAYQARDGESWRLVVDGKANGGTRTRFAMHAFSGDAAPLVYVDEADDEGWGRLVVSDLGFERPMVVDARVSSVVLNADRTRVAAVSASERGQQVLTFAADAPGRVTRGPLHDAIYNVAFAPEGTSLAYLAERGGQFSMVLDDREAPVLPGEDIISLPVVRPGAHAVAAMFIANGAVVLREFFGQGGAGEPAYQSVEGLVFARDGRSHAYAAERGESWFVVVNGKEGPTFDKVVSPAFSPDGTHLVYRARKDGKRFVVIADAEGKTIRQLPAYEQVFPVHFTADGKSIAYGVKDGRKLAWKVEPL
jgi:hypothetical protein